MIEIAEVTNSPTRKSVLSVLSQKNKNEEVESLLLPDLASEGFEDGGLGQMQELPS